MRVLLRLPTALVAIVAALFAPSALARCAGLDLMAELAKADPVSHDRIFRRAREVPNGQGIFWRVISPSGLVSYLYGTLHSTEATARWLPREAVDALGAARVVMVELAPEEQKRLESRLASDPHFALDTDGPGLSERLDHRALARAEPVLAKRGLTLAAAERLKPWLLISTIAVPLCEKTAIASGKRLLDDAIAAEARAWSIPVRGLESFEQTFGAFESLTDAELTGLLIDGITSAEEEEDLRRTLETLYARGEIAAIMEFNIWHATQVGLIANPRQSADALTRALITDRNLQWMPKIVPEIELGGAFIAFGALHLPGDFGIVALLREAGFSVERADP